MPTKQMWLALKSTFQNQLVVPWVPHSLHSNSYTCAPRLSRHTRIRRWKSSMASCTHIQSNGADTYHDILLGPIGRFGVQLIHVHYALGDPKTNNFKKNKSREWGAQVSSHWRLLRLIWKCSLNDSRFCLMHERMLHPAQAILTECNSSEKWFPNIAVFEGAK